MSTFAFLKLSALVAVLVLATPAAAQSTDEHHDNQAPQTLPAPALNGMPGLGMPGLGMTGPMGPMSGSGAQSPGMGGMMQMMQLIAGYKSALAITDAQLPQWNAFADSLRAGAKHIQQARSATTPAAPAPAQLEQRAAVLEAEASAMKQSEASAAALYDVLSAPQKRAADRLIADHLARM